MQACLCFTISNLVFLSDGYSQRKKVQIGDDKTSFHLLCVYFPAIPTLVTGSVFTLRKNAVMKLGNSSSEVLNLLLYAFRSPAALKYLPWEDESPEEFKERSKLFDLSKIQSEIFGKYVVEYKEWECSRKKLKINRVNTQKYC